MELFLNSTVILNVFCNGLSKDTKPDNIGTVVPVAKLKEGGRHPNTT